MDMNTLQNEDTYATFRTLGSISVVIFQVRPSFVCVVLLVFLHTCCSKHSWILSQEGQNSNIPTPPLFLFCFFLFFFLLLPSKHWSFFGGLSTMTTTPHLYCSKWHIYQIRLRINFEYWELKSALPVKSCVEIALHWENKDQWKHISLFFCWFVSVGCSQSSLRVCVTLFKQQRDFKQKVLIYAQKWEGSGFYVGFFFD